MPLPNGGNQEGIADAIKFIQDTYHGLKYLISVCNGAILLAQSGVLDGHEATSSKLEWDAITSAGPKTHWKAKARWVTSGNILTTSGVSAGIDGAIAWMATMVPEETIKYIVDAMEYRRVQDSDDDPFAGIHGCKDVEPRAN